MEPERGLTAEQRAQIELAVALHRPLARAAAIARSNARGYVAFGVLTLLVAGLGADALGLAVGSIVTGVGVSQLRAVKRLLRADPAAPRTLARNELVLLGGIAVYALLKLTVLRETGEDYQDLVGDTRSLGIDLVELTRSVNTLVYSTVLAVTLLYQGGLALYYLRRKAPLERYLTEVPDWAREMAESMGD